MRHRWLRSLALSLGVLIMGHLAVSSPPALGAEEPGPIIQPYPPVPQRPSSSQPDAAPAELPSAAVPTQAAPPGSDELDPAPAATLDRPVAIRAGESMVDTQVLPTGLLFNRRSAASTSSSSAGSLPTAQSLSATPNGTSLSTPSAAGAAPQQPDVPYTWRQPPTPTTPAAPDPAPATVLPPPSGSLVPPPNGSLVPPPNGSFVPPPNGSLVPPPSGSLVPPPNGSFVPGPSAGPTGIGGPPGDSCGAPGCGGPSCGGPGCGAPGCGAPGCGMPGCGAPGCCGAESCDGCGCGWNDYCGWSRGCCFGNRWYGSAEYLLWFIRGQPLPPLLTTGPLTDNPPGAIGQPGTQVLFGGTSLNNNPYSGSRLRLGYWFNDCHSLGLEIGGFFLGGNTNNFSQSSMGLPFLARPFFNVLTNAQDIEAVATPNGLTGTFSASNTFLLYGAEANVRRNLFCGCNWYVDGFVGWRLLGLNETLKVQENLAVASSTNPSLPAGSTFLVSDRFGTTNLFNGGQIGGIFEYRLRRWSVDVRASVALGGTQENVNISGSTLSQAPGQQGVLATGGLLAQSSNIGHFSRDVLTVVPEVGINLGYQLTNHIRGFVGYNFLYWSNVARPGNQVDQGVNPNLIPPSVPGGPSRPTFDFKGSDFWAQGINFGLDIRW